METIIALPDRLFYGTSIATNILVLSKHKESTEIQFIDATSEQFYKKDVNNNILTEEHITALLELFASKQALPNISTTVDYRTIVENSYNLSVKTYLGERTVVQETEAEEETDIRELNTTIEEIVKKIDTLRTDINEQIRAVEHLARRAL